FLLVIKYIMFNLHGEALVFRGIIERERCIISFVAYHTINISTKHIRGWHIIVHGSDITFLYDKRKLNVNILTERNISHRATSKSFMSILCGYGGDEFQKCLLCKHMEIIIIGFK
ncbi:hypothetical protein ACJX0J_016698, partial [Zea mays]